MAATLLLLFLLLLLRPSSAVDRLSPGESITANRTLSSGAGTVVLGFFSPSGNPATSYLGIWRSGSDVRTALWVANREAPLPRSRAVFRLSNSSNLEVADSNGTLFWSSGTSSPNPKRTAAVLSDNGNLVLRSEVGAVLWQSFDHPTDTVLPGMPVWVNYKTHVATTGFSWRSPVDPSPGDFRLSVDPDTPLQVVVTKMGSGKHWRSNVWNGGSFTNRGTGNTLPYLSFSLDATWWNISFSSSNPQPNILLRLEASGTVLVLWFPTTKVWTVLYRDPPACAPYGLCGAFGLCSLQPPTCRCLDGFEPRNRSEWDGGDHRGGCVRRYAMVCDGRDEFVRFPEMKLPDYNTYLREVADESSCREACRSNCSCSAYAFTELRMVSAAVPRCLVWSGELLDLVHRVDSSGEDLYVRVQLESSPSESKDNKLVALVAIPAGLAFLVAIACILRKCSRASRKKGEEDTRNLNGFGIEIEQGGQDMLFLNFETILAATNNFSEANVIGQGGFGIVYKGKLDGRAEVAIKRLSEESSQGLVEFKNEVVLIAQLQHRNLVELLSCCIHGEEKLLIYNYMPNRSLDLLLFDSEKQWFLDWDKRFSIIKGIARGLLYLHEDSRLKVIHRDLKASNILLDGDLNAKISDFGMARIFDSSQNQENTKRVVGTYGYMSPEYAMEGQISVKSDVYSFGVLLLEIISGRRNTSFRQNKEFPSLLSYAWNVWRSENLQEMLAPSVGDSYSLHEVGKCIHMGLLCVQDDPAHRPNMSKVVFLLENDTSITSAPEMPNFTGWERQDDSGQQNWNLEAVSVNNLSVSVMEGR